MQHTRTHASPAALASELSSVWDKRATATPIAAGSDRVLVNIVDPHHDTLSKVCEWLAKRWEVLWVEGKPRNKPMVREAVKLLTHETGGTSDAQIAIKEGVLVSKDEVCFSVCLCVFCFLCVCMDCVHDAYVCVSCPHFTGTCLFVTRHSLNTRVSPYSLKMITYRTHEHIQNTRAGMHNNDTIKPRACIPTVC
jgi:hypothetical protein